MSATPTDLQGVIGFVNEQPHLVVDTSLFDKDLQGRVLGLFDRLDDNTDGVVIHADNFQALSLLQARYREQVKCIYIDPPYNTGGDGFVYKNNYRHSSWMTMMWDRLHAGRELLGQDGVMFQSIDDGEQSKLKELTNGVFGNQNFLFQIAWRRTDNQPNIGNFARVKEYRYQDEHGLFRRAILLGKTRGRHSYPVTTKSGNILMDPWMIKETELEDLNKIMVFIGQVADKSNPMEKHIYPIAKGKCRMTFGALSLVQIKGLDWKLKLCLGADCLAFQNLFH